MNLDYLDEALISYVGDINLITSDSCKFQDDSNGDGIYIKEWNIAGISKPAMQTLLDLAEQIRISNIRRELINLIDIKRQEISYGGYSFLKDNRNYIVSTKEINIGKSALRVTRLINTSQTSTKWRIFDVELGKAEEVEFTTQEYLDLLIDIDNFVDLQFTKQTNFETELNSKTDAELTIEYVNDLKGRIDNW